MDPAFAGAHAAEHAGAAPVVPPPIGTLAVVGGTSLFHHVEGSGGPAIVFLPGAGGMGLDYLNLFHRVAALSTAVLYDRGGTGWSGEATLPRSAPDVAVELQALLRTLDLAPPYLLVGHSLGGAFARHYAQCFPRQVAGLLLLDPAHEALEAHYPEEVRALFAQFADAPVPDLPPEVLDLWRAVFADKLQRWPEPLRGSLIARHVAKWRAGFLEGQRTEALVYDALRQGGPLPDVPLTVLTAMGIDRSPTSALPEAVQHAVNAAKQAVNRLLAGSVPRGQERALHDATHVWMHIEREDTVVEAIAEVLRRVR